MEYIRKTEDWYKIEVKIKKDWKVVFVTKDLNEYLDVFWKIKRKSPQYKIKGSKYRVPVERKQG